MNNCVNRYFLCYTLSLLATACWTAEAFTSLSAKKILIAGHHFDRDVSSTEAWSQNTNSDNDIGISRRLALWNGAISLFGMMSASEVMAEDDDKTRGGVPLTPFNGLPYNYRGNEFGGLDASTLNEPSIPYSEFLQKLESGEVEFVEFFAPDGDAAYATFKSKEGEEKLKSIRIGEGYPIEQHRGWSSPAFVVKSVARKGVPYKFTVPGLSAYR
mmetsp:Transcript_11313/g.10827  ORF Transcript_11313/g.10827 Transcript_11313/m.10827 type:complete len:214 (-) Transcript_11313:155-796(-)|eukprot:CAMPEP_0197832934 /NCGR_PEP_ID=MMETSP1437-20131217/16983_1 /TAXON_ID=49252 ORGANISM="Eucampia antarctica, Strain CCMP1452" /NCGR_SAMPLE_ID=MMETSP1437 /ASSEMBLY_ACC=CAM_ASM_001096 /LENGTH=213 /DNA_ID=CAMNT_0043436613 /DNA_START=61 /DNA_END=702 /DNA_ORIENTATION=+